MGLWRTGGGNPFKPITGCVKTYWIRFTVPPSGRTTQGRRWFRPCPVAFPGQTALADNDNQFLFCDDFLVSPVLTENAHYREVTLPAGSWYSLWKGDKVKGGQTIQGGRAAGQVSGIYPTGYSGAGACSGQEPAAHRSHAGCRYHQRIAGNASR